MAGVMKSNVWRLKTHFQFPFSRPFMSAFMRKHHLRYGQLEKSPKCSLMVRYQEKIVLTHYQYNGEIPRK